MKKYLCIYIYTYKSEVEYISLSLGMQKLLLRCWFQRVFRLSGLAHWWKHQCSYCTIHIHEYNAKIQKDQSSISNDVDFLGFWICVI